MTKSILIIGVSLMIIGCNVNSKKSAAPIDLDIAIKHNDISNVEISNNRIVEFINDTIEEVIEDRVVFSSKTGIDASQTSPIYYKDEVLNSKLVRFYSNKKIKYQAQCVDGWLNGYVYEYDSLGNLEATLHYTKGKLNGTCKLYWSNNKLAKLTPYIQGKKQGVEKAYHKNGKLAFVGEFRENEKNGEHRYYFSNGKLSSVQRYSFGDRPHGLYANKMEKGYRANGSFIDYFENGQIKYKAQYLNGLPEGEVLCFYSKDKLAYCENWHNGNIVGKALTYYENGQLKAEGMFNEAGKETGEWNEYYDNGKLRLKLKFENGKIIEQHYYNNPNEHSYIKTVEDLRSIFPGAETRY